jgi:hypothetical protein
VPLSDHHLVCTQRVVIPAADLHVMRPIDLRTDALLLPPRIEVAHAVRTDLELQPVRQQQLVTAEEGEEVRLSPRVRTELDVVEHQPHKVIGCLLGSEPPQISEKLQVAAQPGDGLGAAAGEGDADGPGV